MPIVWLGSFSDTSRKASASSSRRGHPTWPRRCPCCNARSDTKQRIWVKLPRPDGRRGKRVRLQVPYCKDCVCHGWLHRHAGTMGVLAFVAAMALSSTVVSSKGTTPLLEVGWIRLEAWQPIALTFGLGILVSMLMRLVGAGMRGPRCTSDVSAVQGSSSGFYFSNDRYARSFLEMNRHLHPHLHS